MSHRVQKSLHRKSYRKLSRKINLNLINDFKVILGKMYSRMNTSNRLFCDMDLESIIYSKEFFHLFYFTY